MSRPNVLVVVLDATRADHLSCYGHDRPTTPTVDRLAASGVRYTSAFSNSNWTGTSHGALFTGQLPSHSGVYAGQQTLPADVETLPERLQAAGYDTFGMSAGTHLRESRGYDRGFDVFKETYRVSPSLDFLRKAVSDPPLRAQTLFSATRGPDDKTLYKFRSLRRWIRRVDGPFFGFINAKTAHHPYNPPRPYKSMFCPDLRRARYQFVEELFGDEFGERQTVPGEEYRHLQRLSYQYPVIAGEIPADTPSWETIRAWYDGAVRYVDDRLGELVDELDRLGELEHTYVFVTADHGEYFGEHGLEKHYYSLYEPVLHVPLVVHTPDGVSVGEEDSLNDDGGGADGAAPGSVHDDRGQEAAVTVDEPVSLVDLYPTIVELAGESVDREHAASLVPLGDGPGHDHVFAELGEVGPEGITRHHPGFDDSGYGDPVQVVRDDEYKLLVEDGEAELYEWRADPAESTDRADDRPAVRDRLAGVVDAELGELTHSALSEDIEDSDLQDHLEELGYM